MLRQSFLPILFFMLMNYSCKCQDLEKFVAPILNQQMAPLMAIVDTTNISSHIVRSIEKPLREMINATIEYKVNEKLKEDIVSIKILGNVNNKFDALQQKMDEHIGDNRNQLTGVKQNFATLEKEMEERIKQDIVSLRKEIEERVAREIRDKLNNLTRTVCIENKDLDEKLTKLINNVDVMQSDLKETIVSVDNNVTNLASQLKNHLTSLEGFRSNLQELTVNTSTIQNATGKLKTTTDIDKGMLKVHASKLKDINATVMDINLRVSLFGCVEHTYTLTSPSTIKFPNIKTSEGITVQRLTSFELNGEFVCDVPGLYHIYVEIQSYDKYGFVKISKNNIELMLSYRYTYITGVLKFTYSNAAFVLTKLQEGDTIDIKPGEKIMHINGQNYSHITIVKVT